jgi:hypothetical protein
VLASSAARSLTTYRCIGSIIVCASQNIAMLVVGRFINGNFPSMSFSNISNQFVS